MHRAEPSKAAVVDDEVELGKKLSHAPRKLPNLVAGALAIAALGAFLLSRCRKGIGNLEGNTLAGQVETGALGDIAWHQLRRAQLTPNRFKMLLCLNESIHAASMTVEIGVQAGYFSNAIVKMFEPDKHIMMDIDLSHSRLMTIPEAACRAKQAAPWRHDCGTFASLARHEANGRIEWFEGRSTAGLATLPEASAAFIYIDADHLGEAPAQELALAATKLRADGAIGLNDYIYFDHVANQQYTVKHAVHGFLRAHADWEVVLLGMHRRDFNDIVIQRKQAPARRCPST